MRPQLFRYASASCSGRFIILAPGGVRRLKLYRTKSEDSKNVIVTGILVTILPTWIENFSGDFAER